MSSIRELALAKAIGGSGGGGGDITVEPLTVTENGQYAAPTGKAYSPVNVDVSGGGGASANAVNFRDYDGTIVQSYSAADFAALTAMPENPSHDGLTAQGWNWTLAKAQAYVAKYGRLEIGQMYITDDGKTRVYIHLEQGRTSPMLGVCPNGTVDVDWGDGTAHDTLTGTSVTTVKWTPNHAYAVPGDYVIKLTVTGSMGFYGQNSNNAYSGLLRYAYSADGRNFAYWDAIQKIEIGNGITSIGSTVFYNCYSLTSITIPDSVTSIGSNAFYYCFSLASITIPDSVTNIDGSAFYNCHSLTNVALSYGVTNIGGSAFYNCHSLTNITIPDSVTNVGGSAFYNCYSLANVTIPNSVTNIGNSAFSNCYGLASVTIATNAISSVFANCYNLTNVTLLDGVTSISSSMFSYCTSLKNITIPDSVTSIGGSAFSHCVSLASITIPDSVTSIGNDAFSNCYGLASVTIPNSVTSVGGSVFTNCYGLVSVQFSDSATSIGGNSLYYCASLANVTIPNSVTSIGSSAFSSCFSVAEYHLMPTTPPTLSNTNAFSGISADCVIYVPYSADHSILEAYKTAANWSSYASYMQEEAA